MPDKRTITVLASLAIGMALTAGVLRMLKPGAVPPISGVTLLSIERNASERPEDKLFDTTAQRDWQAIVIHDSRTAVGSYDSIDRAHRRSGKDGCGYHLIVNNGSGAQDGRIEVGYRWKYQDEGDYLMGPNADWYHDNAVGICVIGDADQSDFTDSQMRELVWLVRQLQRRFEIPPKHVFVDMGEDSALAAQHFPQADFRQQLLGPLAASH